MMANQEMLEYILSTNGNKIRVEYCSDLKLETALKNISEKKLNIINKWILRYCFCFRRKNISSLWISGNQKGNISSIKWTFNNTKNDIGIHKIVTRIMNNYIKKQGGYITSMQRNNRGYFILFFS